MKVLEHQLILNYNYHEKDPLTDDESNKWEIKYLIDNNLQQV